jgi:hypothetical protein
MSSEPPTRGAEGAGGHEAIVTPSALVIPLEEHHRRQAKECLDRSGSVKFSFKEISATSLTGVAELAEVIID